MILATIGGWEIVVILGVLLILLVSRSRLNLLPPKTERQSPPSLLFGLWVAQGFGVGLIPFAPGTFGSLIGVLWFGLLLSTCNLWIFLLGLVFGMALSIWLCGMAERLLKQTDPGSVVLDEIIAIPLCFLSWVLILFSRKGSLPVFEDFFNKPNWSLALAIFVLFRFFDVIKPWPVRQSQAFPGGWGVTIDDVLAAAYVNVVVLVVYFGRMLFVK